MLTLNYKEFGQGQPIIILHGLFGMLDNWQTISKQLGEHYGVYAIDQRNHGRSPHTDDIDYQILSEDLRQFMQAHWIYKAVIIGHSMGGKTAMQFALDNPDMVEKLIVIDIAPKAYKGGHELYFESIRSIDLATVTSRNEVEEHLKINVTDFGTRQFLMKNLHRNEEDNRFEWKINFDALYNNYQKILGNIEGETFEGETLFIRGAKSNYIAENEPVIGTYFPNATIQTIEDAGHWVHADQPKRLLASILTFLQ
jgi:esterase